MGWDGTGRDWGRPASRPACKKRDGMGRALTLFYSVPPEPYPTWDGTDPVPHEEEKNVQKHKLFKNRHADLIGLHYIHNMSK